MSLIFEKSDEIEIYYDGVKIKDFNGEEISGFTTNISFLKAAGIQNYDEFIKDCLVYSTGRPISFQLYDDNDDDIETMAKKIQSYSPSIFVKVPVIKTDNSSNANIIKKLHDQGIQINCTVIFTKEQIDSLKDCFGKEINVIISIFAGRINDCGIDCTDVVKHAVDTFKEYKNIKILWAACRTVYNIVEAQNQGAHIVTVPDSVLTRMHRLKQTPLDASIETVNVFRNDGIIGKILF
jgi:transaldolase